MGLAIIIPDVSFADKNLGQVTLTDNVPIENLDIVSPQTFTGTNLLLSISYTPLNTTERGVLWSIISGSQHATINETTGVLTVNSGVISEEVTVKATSTANTGIYATATVTVTYRSDSDIPLAYLGTVSGNYCDTGVKFANNDSLSFKGRNYSGYSPFYTDGQNYGVSDDTMESRFNFIAVVLPGYGKMVQHSGSQIVGTLDVSMDALGSATIKVNGTPETLGDMSGGGISSSTIKLFKLNTASDPHARMDYERFVIEGKISLSPCLHEGVPCFWDELSGDYFYINGSNNIYYALASNPATEIIYVNE